MTDQVTVTLAPPIVQLQAIAIPGVPGPAGKDGALAINDNLVSATNTYSAEKIEAMFAALAATVNLEINPPTTGGLNFSQAANSANLFLM